MNEQYEISTKSKALERAVSLFGGQRQLARVCGTKQQNVHKWVKSGAVPALYVFRIEAATRLLGDPVLAKDLCPEMFEINAKLTDSDVLKIALRLRNINDWSFPMEIPSIQVDLSCA